MNAETCIFIVAVVILGVLLLALFASGDASAPPISPAARCSHCGKALDIWLAHDCRRSA